MKKARRKVRQASTLYSIYLLFTLKKTWLLPLRLYEL
jgi:hypothetical protein